MWESPPGWLQCQLQVSQPQTSAKRRYVRRLVNTDALELLQIDRHRAVLAAGTIGPIRVSTGAGLHLEVVLGCAEHGVRDILVGSGDDDHGWLELKAEIVS